MKLSECKKCCYHLKAIADSTLCRFGNEAECKIVYNGEVLSCPIDSSLQKIFVTKNIKGTSKYRFYY